MTERPGHLRPGDPRTGHQWLLDLGWELDDPAEVDAAELERVMNHDEFWEWSSGKVAIPAIGNATWPQAARELLVIGLMFGALFLGLAIVQWLAHQ